MPLLSLRILHYYVVLLLLQKVTFSWGSNPLSKPIWNIAHMVNTIPQVNAALDAGANALEFDIYFEKNGEPKYTFHGVPCDCFRECTYYERFIPFIKHLSRLTSPGDPLFRSKLVLLNMDLKVNKLSRWAQYWAGTYLIRILLDYYWKEGSVEDRAYILLSVPSTDNVGVFRSIIRGLDDQNEWEFKKRIGFNFVVNDDFTIIRNAFDSVGITKGIWQSDGISNCLLRGQSRLKEAIRKRYNSRERVYTWTYDYKRSMRSVLRLGVDGIVTNHPTSLSSILREDEFAYDYRLARIEDDPWRGY